jgi:hypothetical protein
MCSWGAVTPRDLISLSLYKGLSRDQTDTNLRSSYTMDDCIITSDTPMHPCGKLCMGSIISFAGRSESSLAADLWIHSVISGCRMLQRQTMLGAAQPMGCTAQHGV